MDTSLKNRQFDILHAHFGINGAIISEIKRWKHLKGIRFITTFHGYDMHKPSFFKNYYQYLFTKGDLFTVNSNYSRNLLENLGCLSKKIEKLPVGLNTSLFVSNRPIKVNNCINILFVGRLIEFKAPNLVVTICSELQSKNINFKCRIIGDGELFESLSEQIKFLSLQDKIELYGGQTQEEIIHAMDKSDIFLYPGIYDKTGRAENQGLVLQEAQCMKLPVLVSNVGGMPEGLINGITGYVLNVGDIQGFVEKIEFLYRNPQTVEKMGNNARDFVENNFSSEALGNKLECIYLNLLRNNQ